MTRRLSSTSPAPPELKPLIEKYRTETCQNGECLKVTPQKWDEMQQTGEAICLCQKCPVAMQCLVQALVYEAGLSHDFRYEMWGGTTPQERFLIDITACHASVSDSIARTRLLAAVHKQGKCLKRAAEQAGRENRLEVGECYTW